MFVFLVKKLVFYIIFYIEEPFMKRSYFFLFFLGIFAILCQLFFLCLLVEIQREAVSADVLYHRYFPYLEYPLTSLILLLGGVILFRLSERSMK